MEVIYRIPCTIMHPKLFPPFFLFPLRPSRSKVFVEIDLCKLSFLSTLSSGESKSRGSVTIDSISSVAVENLSLNAQRVEILRNVFLSNLLLAAFLSLYLFVFKSAPLFMAVIISLISAMVFLPLSFLFDGGFTVKSEVVRFIFTPVDLEKTFYLEVAKGCEAELQQALLVASLQFTEDKNSEEIWTCDECGAVVEASTMKCPNCGANFED
jgi:hypothetical protein